MRTIMLLAFVVSLPLHAATLIRDDLIGIWQLDTERVAEAQQQAAAKAAAVEGWGMRLTSRIGRVTWSDGAMHAGMWRIEDATENACTVVIQSKGGSEHRYHVTIDGNRMVCQEQPSGLPLIRP